MGTLVTPRHVKKQRKKRNNITARNKRNYTDDRKKRYDNKIKWLNKKQ